MGHCSLSDVKSAPSLLVRVYDTLSGELIQELRRGADKAEVYSIAFSAGATMLACTSDKGTVHIFRLKEAVHDLPVGAAPAALPASAAPPPIAGSPVGGASSTSASAATARATPASAAGAAAATGSGATSGDADTVYFGSGSGTAGAGGESNTKSSLSFIRGILPKYFSSEWSFAQFRVPDTRSICSFGQEPNTIIGECEPLPS